MTIEVLGLGETVSTFKPNENVTVGVNDIFKFHPVQHLILADGPKKFREPDRFKTIIQSTPEKFYCFEPWPVLNFVRIHKALRGRGRTEDLDTNGFIYSISSPFIACVLAYKLGGKNIIMHGVDFNTHNCLSKPHTLKKVIDDFKTLNLAFKVRGVSLFVSSRESALSKVLPVVK